tara:strand:- start:21 stop:260 length:240 start_codon:yes stop_codon:yes gene_type:complete
MGDNFHMAQVLLRAFYRVLTLEYQYTFLPEYSVKLKQRVSIKDPQLGYISVITEPISNNAWLAITLAPAHKWRVKNDAI